MDSGALRASDSHAGGQEVIQLKKKAIQPGSSVLLSTDHMMPTQIGAGKHSPSRQLQYLFLWEIPSRTLY